MCWKAIYFNGGRTLPCIKLSQIQIVWNARCVRADLWIFLFWRELSTHVIFDRTSPHLWEKSTCGKSGKSSRRPVITSSDLFWRQLYPHVTVTIVVCGRVCISEINGHVDRFLQKTEKRSTDPQAPILNSGYLGQPIRRRYYCHRTVGWAFIE
jgi:hypothetical protein